jgi:cytochrome c
MHVSLPASLTVLALVALGGCGEPNTKPAAADAPPSASAEEATKPAAPAAAPGAPSAEFAALPEPYKSASYSVGRRTAQLCQSCHLNAEGAGNLVGPNLHGLFGRKVASVADFDYSPAMKAEDFVWTPEQLDHWLANPGTFIKGNRMTFSGVRREVDRTAVIAYLMVETGYEPPADAAPADEAPAE